MFSVKTFSIITIIGLVAMIVFKTGIPHGVATAVFGVFFILAFIMKVFSEESLS